MLSFFLSLPVGPALLLLRWLVSARAQAPRRPRPGGAAPLNFLNFGRPGTPVNEPDGFVPHLWADRDNADEGLL